MPQPSSARNRPVTTTACAPGPGLTDDASDCDDGNPDVFSGAVEICNERDDDCDGEIDPESLDCPDPDAPDPDNISGEVGCGCAQPGSGAPAGLGAAAVALAFLVRRRR